MFRRYELHNHTTQSDAAITCEELAEIMADEQVDVFALTDHNTISGHAIMKKLLGTMKDDPQCIYGMEYTTYYGHILCPILSRYVPWDSINRNKAELLFQACHEAGALAGIAHPMAFGEPFARGCRFEMTVNNFDCVDFIEIFNNSERLHEVNARSMEWWESLCLQGRRIAATAGMDLHRRRSFAMSYATYLSGEADGDPESELTKAIRSGQTWVSNGLLLVADTDPDGLGFHIADVKKPGFRQTGELIMTLRSETETCAYTLTGDTIRIPESRLPAGRVLIPKLFMGDTALEHLVCISPVIFRNRSAE